MNRLLQPGRVPAAAILLAWIAGVLLHATITVAPHSWVVAAVALATLSIVFRRFAILASFLLIVAIALTGAADTQLEHFRFHTNDIGLFTTDAPTLARVRLHLSEEPTTMPAVRGSVKQVMLADAVAIETKNGWQPTSGQVDVEVEHADGRLHVNQSVGVIGLLARPLPASNPGQFDWAVLDRSRRTLATLIIPRGNAIELLDDHGPTAIQEERQTVRAWLTRGFTPEQATDVALLKSMLLGDRDPALTNLREDFENAGIAFQLGAGGLHVALLAGFIVLLGRWLCLRPRHQIAIVTAFVLAYAALAVPTDSGRRAILLTVAAAGALLLHQSTYRPQLLMLVIWVLLVVHPLDLYSPGFQLGAVAVVGLVMLSSQAREIVTSLTDPHMVVAPKTDRPLLHRTCGSLLAAAIRIAQVSVVVWLVTLPLLAYHFGATSAWAILASVIVLPVVIATLAGGLLKMAITMPVPPAAHALALMADAPVRLLRWIVHGIAGLPGAGFTLAAPTVAVIVIYYVLLFLPLAPLRLRITRFARFAPLVGVVLIFASGWITSLTSTQPTLRVVLLSVGAGQCAVIEPPDGSPWMFDAGSSSVSDPARSIVGPFLKHDHRDRLAGVVLSHGDYDHISATPELEDTFGPMPAYISPHFRPNAIGNVPDQELIKTLNDDGEPPRLLAVGDHLQLSKHVGVDVLWPPVAGNLNSNNAGLVLRLNFGGRRILFPADLQDAGFRGLLEHPEQLSADVLVAAHHGSSESLTPAILRAVHPQLIVASSGHELTKKQRTFNAMAVGTRLLRTTDSGAITISITADGKMSVDTYLSHGRKREEND